MKKLDLGTELVHTDKNDDPQDLSENHLQGDAAAKEGHIKVGMPTLPPPPEYWKLHDTKKLNKGNSPSKLEYSADKLAGSGMENHKEQ